MKTSGFKDYRLNKDDPYHEMEIKAVEEFNKYYLEDANLIVFGQKEGFGIEPNDYLTEREEKIVLSVIQWIGTPVGIGFVKQLIK